MNVPQKVRIGAFDYEIALKKKVDDGGNIASIEYQSRQILLQKKLADSSYFELLWHESIHGLMEQAGLRLHDEPLVNQISAGICQLLRDNPYLRGEHLFGVPGIITMTDLGDEAKKDIECIRRGEWVSALPDTLEQGAESSKENNGK